MTIGRWQWNEYQREWWTCLNFIINLKQKRIWFPSIYQMIWLTIQLSFISLISQFNQCEDEKGEWEQLSKTNNNHFNSFNKQQFNWYQFIHFFFVFQMMFHSIFFSSLHFQDRYFIFVSLWMISHSHFIFLVFLRRSDNSSF